MLYCFDFSEIKGSLSSVPNNDHVPQLRNKKSSSFAGTATIAHCVSCPATATTLAGFIINSSSISVRIGESTVPGSIIFVRMLSGNPSD